MPTIITPQRKKKDPFTNYGYTVVVERIPERGYTAIILALPQVQGFGRTVDQAVKSVHKDFRSFIKQAIEMGERFPGDLKSATTRIAGVV